MEGMQTAFRTVDAESRIESRYVQSAVDPCGAVEHGVFPLVFHGLSQIEVHRLTVHACDHGTKHAYSVGGELSCGADTTCATARSLAARSRVIPHSVPLTPTTHATDAP